MWEITRDVLLATDKVVQSVDFEEERRIELVHKFRLLDDDAHVYYIGMASSNDDEEAFSPLDDYGEGNDGCTEIQYFNENTGKWETL